MSSIQNPLQIGQLSLPHRLIQGPLAGYSCAPFRRLFRHFIRPAFAVSEMISAQDILHKHQTNSRYLYRANDEGILAYQIAGQNPATMAAAAEKLQDLGADLIDINCGCPKAKIRQKGAGSALLDKPLQLIQLVSQVKARLQIPLTVKIRINHLESDRILVKALAENGADAIIIHGRRWQDDYDVANNFQHIAQLKEAISIPVIANGDISDQSSLAQAMRNTGADGFMISRAGTGKPWLYAALLENKQNTPHLSQRIEFFMEHLTGLAELEGQHMALLQSRSLLKYYFRDYLTPEKLPAYYSLNSLSALEKQLQYGV